MANDETDRAPITSDSMPYWKRCERSWAAWLRSQNWSVTPLTDAVGNTDGTLAPMIQLPGLKGRHPVPDFHCIRQGRTRFYEVKSRLGPEVDALTGIRRHWMLRRSFEAYLKIARTNDTPVWVAVHERATATTAARWLEIPLAKIDEVRLEGVMTFEEGDDEVVLWPAELMHIVDAPPVAAEDDRTPPLPVRRHELTPASEDPVDAAADGTGRFGADFLSLSTEEKRLRAGLENLRRAIGVPVTPQYSVLRVGDAHDRLLELTEYGIRVFLITAEDPEDSHEGAAARRRALLASRLVECVVLPDLPVDHEHWQVDGRDVVDVPEWLEGVLERADRNGGINRDQYRIVHASADSDVSVMAGAGTGKTETMSERLLFLLSTSRANAPAELRLTDVAIITFSREAAAQIARRIASTLAMRRRLCPRNVHPVLAWLTQVGAARISTIHQFARHLIAVSGARIGLSPEFTVSSGTMRLRELVTDALAVPLAELYRAHGRRPPPVHEWRRHIEAVWDVLQNNGVRLMEDPGVPCVRWGPQATHLDAVDQAIIALVQETIDRVRAGFRARCIEEQFLPTGQLIPWARRVLDDTAGGMSTGADHGEPSPTGRAHPDLRFRHLFVDEFQDTDEEQLQLVLAVRRHLGARLFVVGDVKQGIYRFRGAAGNAFSSLERQVAQQGLPAPMPFTLTRNFRTGKALLDSLHPFFKGWRMHAMRLLDYEDIDRLTANPGPGEDRSTGVSIRTVSNGGWEEETAGIIEAWRNRDPEGRFAVLCRRNSDAKKVHARLLSLGIPCDIRTGHDFYQTAPVHETRAFLQAVMDPDDSAALLELLETRWGIALMLRRTTIRMASTFDWEAETPPISPWDARLASLADGSGPHVADLEDARMRVAYLASVARGMSPLAFLILCRDLLRPEDHGDGGDGDRYGRAVDHLVTLMDEQFADAPVTLGGVIDWLRDRIATDDTEDGPPPDDDGKGVVRIITVHRAKGLEFDRVVIANTHAMFGAHRHVTTVAAVLPDADGRHRALWRWKERGDDDWRWMNPDGRDPAWTEDVIETCREETRLLYVAMTRARHELVILCSGRRREPRRPERWSDLLADGRG